MSSNAYNPAGSTASSGFAGAPLPPGMGLRGIEEATGANSQFGVALIQAERDRQLANNAAWAANNAVLRNFRQRQAAANGAIGVSQMANSPSATVRAYKSLAEKQSNAQAQIYNQTTQTHGDIIMRLLQAQQQRNDVLAALSRATASARGDAAALLGEVPY